MWRLDDLERLAEHYHGSEGRFVYRALRWTNARVFADRLPTPLFQWGLTEWGRCLGYTAVTRDLDPIEHPPVVSFHPAIWRRSGRHDRCEQKPCGWACRIDAGPRYTLDVVLHELIHVECAYLLGGWEGHSSHDNPTWCAAIEAASVKLRGTALELPAFSARPTRRVRRDKKMIRVTPDGSLSMAAISRWPHSIREPSYYRAREVPFAWAGADRPGDR